MIWLFVIICFVIALYLAKRGNTTISSDVSLSESKNENSQVTYFIFKKKYPEEEKIVNKFTSCLANHNDFFIPESEVGYNFSTIEQALNKAIAVSKELKDNETTVIFYNVKSNLKLVIPDDRAEILNEAYRHKAEKQEFIEKIELYALSNEMKEHNDYSIKILSELKEEIK